MSAPDPTALSAEALRECEGFLADLVTAAPVLIAPAPTSADGPGIQDFMGRAERLIVQVRAAREAEVSPSKPDDRLVSAARDLLSTSQELLDCVESSDEPDEMLDEALIARARAAIEKATGSAPESRRWPR